jgi:hypothetical protein
MASPRPFLIGLLAITALLGASTLCGAQAYLLDEIGDQDWLSHNQAILGTTAFTEAQSGEGLLLTWYGDDFMLNADIVWTHTFAPPAPGTTAYLEFGLYDIDSGDIYPNEGAVRDVVAGFWLDGESQDDTLFLDAGASDQECYGLYTASVPAALLADGSLSVRLLLSGPGLFGSAGDNWFYTNFNGAGLDFVRLWAEPAAPALSLSVRFASIKWFKQQADLAKVHLWADFGAELPAADDVVAVSFDGIELFAVPFSQFRQCLPSGPYCWANRGLVVRLDFAEGLLFVSTPKMILDGLDLSDGVDVELQLGDGVGAENIPMAEAPGRRAVYLCPDCDGEVM